MKTHSRPHSVFTPITCNDQDACTLDSCINNACLYTPKVCADSNPCTIDACVGGSCVYTPKNCGKWLFRSSVLRAHAHTHALQTTVRLARLTRAMARARAPTRPSRATTTAFALRILAATRRAVSSRRSHHAMTTTAARQTHATRSSVASTLRSIIATNVVSFRPAPPVTRARVQHAPTTPLHALSAITRLRAMTLWLPLR